ncbi:MAG: hypothetical protein ACK5MV_04030 [Aminipila sp.]
MKERIGSDTMRRSDYKTDCTICGNSYNNISFKGGYICEDCIGYISSKDI